MSESSKNESILSLFTRISRHRELSVILLVQNLYYKNLRNLTLNATHIVLFKSPRDVTFTSHLERQMFPNLKNYLQGSYLHATRNPHSYLLINITQQQQQEHRLSSSFFPEEAVIYLPSI